MTLADVPAVLVLAGLAAYAVLAGADFGAGFWQLAPGRDARARRLRAHAHHAMGPVWETNHVWLIFVLVVCWTAYPTAFGSIASTLAVPLLVAGLGIVLRGTAYALRSGADEPRALEIAIALSSILTPLALGAAIGAIAAGRVPVGNARGGLVSSWLAAAPLAVGVLAVATAAYLAAVWLAADAARADERDVEEAYRRRALVLAPAAGAAALLGLVAVHADARRLFDGLTGGRALAAVAVSALAAAATTASVIRRRYEPARIGAAVAVAAVVAGWGLAQWPQLLPGLTVADAAAGRGTIVAILVGLGIGAALLAPSLATLFGLVLRGRFDAAAEPQPAPSAARDVPRPPTAAVAVPLLAGAGLSIGVGPWWGRAAGIPLLLAGGVLLFALALARADEAP